jgi:hypothetical protein
MRSTLTFSLIFFAAVSSAQTRQRAVGRSPIATTWQAPSCTTVSGLPSMRFLLDGTVAANPEKAVNSYAGDIAFSDVPNLMYAVYQGTLFESRDAGCNWKARVAHPALAQSIARIASPRAGYLYLYTATTLLRVRSSAVTALPLPERSIAVAVNPRDPMHVRALAELGGSYESFDGGESWNLLGDATRQFLYSAAFDPSDFNHALAGAGGTGIVRTTDGGRTWTTTSMRVMNVFEISFSPADSRVVWVHAHDALYRSENGGITYSLILKSTPSLPLSRPRLAPHPHDTDTVAIASWAGIGLFDAATRSLSIVKMMIQPGALAWSPADVLYFARSDVVFIAN